jgi:hypothetical protein
MWIAQSCIGIDPDMTILSAAQVGVSSTCVEVKIVVCDMTGFVPFCKQWMTGLQAVCDNVSGAAGSVVIEIPSANDGRAARVRTEDIVRLAGCAGVWAGKFIGRHSQVKLVKPSEWKGTIPKGMVQHRAYEYLNIPSEEAGGKAPYWIPTRGVKVVYVQGNPKQVHWKDMSDSVAMAVWGLRKGV